MARAFMVWMAAALSLCTACRPREVRRPGEVQPSPTSRTPGGRALLVGVSHYEHAAGEHQDLPGAANDVLLMKQLLLEHFGFLPDRVVILSEEEGGKNAQRLPTHHNIQLALEELARQAEEGERTRSASRWAIARG
jgi:hypothetical protein